MLEFTRDYGIWAIITLTGLCLLTDGQIRNHYYSALSYAIPSMTIKAQQAIQLSRILLSLLMIASIFKNIFFRILGTFAYICYMSVIYNPALNTPIDSLIGFAQEIILLVFIIIYYVSYVEKVLSGGEQKNNTEKKQIKSIIKNNQFQQAKTGSVGQKQLKKKVSNQSKNSNNKNK